MTLDELLLRIEAAFPASMISDLSEMASDGRPRFAATFPVPLDNGLVEFRVSLRDGAWSVISSGFVGVSSPDHKAAMCEVERRLLSVSAHELLAARRRRMEAADAN